MNRKLRLAFITLAVIAGCVLAMTAVYALPREPIRRHVEQSADLLREEGVGYEAGFGIDQSRLDNFTDAIMLNASVGIQNQSAVAKALDIRVSSATGSMIVQSSVIESMLLASAPDDLDLVNLDKVAPAEDAPRVGTTQGTFSYGRYWHGYQVLLRPALVFLTYPAIRYVNVLMWLTCVAGLAALIARRLGPRFAFAFLAALSFLSPLTLPMSLTFAGNFYISFALSAAVLLYGSRADWSRRDIELFMVAGMLTSFVDLLTVPLVTLTIPLVLLLLLQQRSFREYDWHAGLTTVSRTSLAWGFGYAVCWGAKWIIGTVVLGRNILMEAAASGVYRTVGEVMGRGFHDFGPVFSNIAPLVPGFGIESALPGPQADVIMVFIVMAAIVISLALALLVRFHHRPKTWSTLLPLAVVATMPYVWYGVLASHSERHYWYTYRSQFGTIFVAIAVFVSLLDWEAVRGAARFVRWKLKR